MGECDFQFEREDEEEVEMDGDLWRELPEHLLYNILAKLPVRSLMRLRWVCKSWSTLITNPVFLETCPRVPASNAPAAALFLCEPKGACWSFPIYDPTLNKWYFLPHIENPHSPSPLATLQSYFVVLASAGGLLCLTDKRFPSRVPVDGNLYVFNPITKAIRLLPPMIRMVKHCIVRLVVDSLKNTYQVLVVLQEGFPDVTLQVLDSASNSWRIVDISSNHEDCIIRSATSIEGVLYGLGAQGSVSAYHMDRGTWEDLRAPMPPSLRGIHLFVSRNTLMMVGSITVNQVIKSTSVWQLDLVRMEWVEVLRVPESLISGLCHDGRLGAYRFHFASGDYMFFAYFSDDQMLICNIVKKSWWWAPPSPAHYKYHGFVKPRRNLSQDFFSVQPSLVASV